MISSPLDRHDYLGRIFALPFTGGGNLSGLIKLADTSPFVENQRVTIRAVGKPVLTCLVGAIPDPSTLLIYQWGVYPYVVQDLSGYGPTNSATIEAPTQFTPNRRGVGVVKFCTSNTNNINMNVDGSHVPVTYSITPAAGTRYQITGLGITLVSSADSTLNKSSMPNISWNLLANSLTLTNGILSTTQINHQISFLGLFKNHIDFMTYPTVNFQCGGGGTSSTWVKYDVSFDIWGGTPLMLDSRSGDYLTFTVQDNLSSLLFFRILTNGQEDSVVVSNNLGI